MGDSLTSKFVLALFSAAMALGAKAIFEAWQRWRTWDLLTAKPVWIGDGWAIQIGNGSNWPIKGAVAYLTLEVSDSDFAPNRRVEMTAPGEEPLEFYLIKPRVSSGPLEELPISWQLGRDAFAKREGVTTTLCPGEAKALKLLRNSRAAEHDPHSDPASSRDDHFEAYWSKEWVVLVASEAGFLEPIACLHRRRYTGVLKVVSESLPAKAFEIEVDPSTPNLLKVLRVIPRPSAIDRWEAESSRE